MSSMSAVRLLVTSTSYGLNHKGSCASCIRYGEVQCDVAVHNSLFWSKCSSSFSLVRIRSWLGVQLQPLVWAGSIQC